MTEREMVEKPYQGFATFLKSSIKRTDRRNGVYGIPFDGATSFRPGARFAPNAIRQASMMLTDGEHPILGRDPSLNVTDMGDIPVASDPVKCVDNIHNSLRGSPFIYDNNRIMVMGGDHLVTLGVLRALRYSRGPMALLHFDAHCDTWSESFDQPIGHGTWLFNAIEEGLVNPTKCISIGVRSPTSGQATDYLKRKGGTTISAREAMSRGAASVADQVMQTIQAEPAYLTFDIDALDPAYAPGTGTPEIGGLTSMFALDLIERCETRKWVGMDVVEVCPAYDHSDITALAAATLLWTFASMR